MIISKELNPKNNLYLIGANIMKIMSSSKQNLYGIMFIYEEYKKKYNKDISLNNLVYGLDWLYLIDVIEYDKDKKMIKKCF